MRQTELAVVMYGQVVGHVRQQSRTSEPEFSYEAAYVAGHTTPLSVLMPVAATTYRGVRVQAFLEGLLPEDPQIRQRWAGRLEVESDDAVGLLSQMGWDCPGAVQFSTVDELDDMLARAHELPRISAGDIATRLRDLRTTGQASWTMPSEHWSLPGQQAKFALTRLSDGWHEAHGSAATTHILKPGIGRLHHQALVEHATMRAADRVGLPVAKTEYAHFDDEPAIVVERYDRIVRKDDTVVRLHQEDFCSAGGRLPSKKYEADGGPGLREMTRTIQQVATDRPQALRALGDFAAFNYISGSPDGHAKNISLLLLPGQTTRLAPLYDLATALPYDIQNPEFRQVAVSIGGRRKFGQVLGKHWDRAADQLSIPSEEFRARARSIAQGFPDAFSDALRAVGSPESENIRQRSMEPIAAHVRHVLDCLDDPVEPTTTPRRGGSGPR
ncbi:MAG: type II toxin-antitoxin system HipA family toxin [Nocardioides sp.]